MTVSLVAAAMDVDGDVVRARAVAENWQCIDGSPSRGKALPDQIIAASAAEGEWQERAAASSGAEPAAGAAETDRAGGARGHRVIPLPGRGPGGAAAATPAMRADVPALPPPATQDAASVIAGASAFVIGQLAALVERAERSGAGLDKKEIDGLSAFAGMIERWEARAREREQEEETTSDEDLARYVRDVNERIVDLAALEARRLLAAGFRPQDDA
ncbi:hypothetical protein [Aquibium microcysteis]|uniref:hypothetical protein n=1 Tax=Aquibium microcysteis TaxID=675281 RepID=UPI00165D0DC3|nr:hypothetical protein [Aquibium microcysteis]